MTDTGETTHARQDSIAQLTLNAVASSAAYLTARRASPGRLSWTQKRFREIHISDCRKASSGAAITSVVLVKPSGSSVDRSDFNRRDIHAHPSAGINRRPGPAGEAPRNSPIFGSSRRPPSQVCLLVSGINGGVWKFFAQESFCLRHDR
jgi:hypothetical protein